ncbi:MAG: hypothetical protein IOC82_11665 [Aestuariivirga sp.]|uniref:sulfotransferase family 2 domain-containing protein n=1 Tax=Aestuariivirga sp. TaxID=2650926 RepID=UPI0025C17E4B|nr:sulfotransferase family 2 domain-containing protein [Aestuariivirga sp.]MCA3561673.1 hypothetical protein [Aestuariivirga sp.]
MGMIICHAKRFIFLKTRKTAGTSFEILLSKYTAPEDVVTPIAPSDEAIRASLGYRGPQNYLARPKADMDFEFADRTEVQYRNHIEAAKVRFIMGQELFDAYLKVSIIRNPFDSAVSWYFWERSRSGPTSQEDFRRWLIQEFAKRTEIQAAYVRNIRPNPGFFASNRTITHIGGKTAVDVMIRYEKFEADIAAFAERVGLPGSLYREFGNIRAKGSYRPASATAATMFTGFEEGKDLILSIFAEEIDTYQYTLGT